jgi:hypothetical protein
MYIVNLRPALGPRLRHPLNVVHCHLRRRRFRVLRIPARQPLTVHVHLRQHPTPATTDCHPDVQMHNPGPGF